MIASGVADVVCFSSYWVGTLRRFHTSASLAGLLGIGVCKHTHGELGIAAAAAHHLHADAAQRDRGGAADGRDHGRRPADDAPADRQRAPLGDSGWRRVSASRSTRRSSQRFADDYRRQGQFLPYAA